MYKSPQVALCVVMSETPGVNRHTLPPFLSKTFSSFLGTPSPPFFCESSSRSDVFPRNLCSFRLFPTEEISVPSNPGSNCSRQLFSLLPGHIFLLFQDSQIFHNRDSALITLQEIMSIHGEILIQVYHMLQRYSEGLRPQDWIISKLTMANNPCEIFIQSSE